MYGPVPLFAVPFSVVWVKLQSIVWGIPALTNKPHEFVAGSIEISSIKYQIVPIVPLDKFVVFVPESVIKFPIEKWLRSS